MLHDGGQLAARNVNVLIGQHRMWSACLPPLVSKSHYTGETLALALADSLLKGLGLQTLPFLLRSDRGGADGKTSRVLAKIWKAFFLPCLAHVLSNVIEEYEDMQILAHNYVVLCHRAVQRAFYNSEGTNGRYFLFSRKTALLFIYLLGLRGGLISRIKPATRWTRTRWMRCSGS